MYAAPASTAHIGKVIRIADGDTLTILAAQRKIRLAEIDAPGPGQLHGNPASKALGDFVFNRGARAVDVNRDRASSVTAISVIATSTLS